MIEKYGPEKYKKIISKKMEKHNKRKQKENYRQKMNERKKYLKQQKKINLELKKRRLKNKIKPTLIIGDWSGCNLKGSSPSANISV